VDTTVNSQPLSDLSVHITRRRRRFVLDANLALSGYGPMLARLLAPHAELWVGPEFLNVLDWRAGVTLKLYQNEQELRQLVGQGRDAAAIAEMPEVLRHWTQLYDEGQHLWYLRDAWRESRVPDDIPETVLPRWEAASQALDLCIGATGPLIAITRDHAALCAVLHACILGHGGQAELPLICQHLQECGLTHEKLSSKHPLVCVERSGFHRLLVEASIAPCIWGGLRLVIVHLFLPHAERLENGQGLGPEDEPAAISGEVEPAVSGNPWEDAKCFWYEVAGPAS
jgi:hypothetical protein